MNRLKQLREEKNLLQSDIALILDVSSRAIGNYETGKRKLNPELSRKIANYFNVSIDYLLGNSDYRNEDDYLMKNNPTQVSPSTEALITNIITEMINSSEPDTVLENFLKVIAEDKKEEFKKAVLTRYDYIKEIKFANNGGLDTNGLDKEDIEELQKQIEFLKFKKGLK